MRLLGAGTTLTPHGLPAPGKMRGAGAAYRMRGEVGGRRVGRHVVSGRGGGGSNRHRVPDRARFGRLILRRDIVEDRREPALDLANRHTLARGIVLDLVTLDLADAEIEAFGVGEIKSRDRGARPHR